MPAKRPTITADEFAIWMTPRDALDLLRELGDTTLKFAILKRLQHNVIRSAAKEARWAGKAAKLFLLDGGEWEHVDTDQIRISPLWRIGDITITIPHTTPAYGLQNFDVEFFDVRFDPVGVQDLLPKRPSPPPTPAVPALQQDKPDDAEQSPLPRVSDHLLRKWHDLYKEAYPGSQDIEERAIASATGMFPGKSVSRQRVRDLRGAQKRGRKPQVEP
jgi:hypothetical protein